MSEQVKRHQIKYAGECRITGYGPTVEMVAARDYDALHAEAEALRANIARLTSNPADHRYWEGRYRDAEAELEAARGLLDQRIPCDVMLPPATTIKRGCPLSTVLASMKLREDVAPNQRVFTATPAPEVRPLTMRDVMQALESVPGAPVLTSNMCHAIAQRLNAHRQAQRPA